LGDYKVTVANSSIGTSINYERQSFQDDILTKNILASDLDNPCYNAWQKIIDNQLIEWGRGSVQFDEENFEAPTKISLKRANELATEFRNGCLPEPLRVVPDGEGGIVFERRSGRFFITIEFSSDGSIEQNIFDDCRLVRTNRWDV
jgi:hypothetical protein